MQHFNKYQPTPKQAASRDTLMAQGYKVVGTEEYPSQSRRKNAPPDTVLVMQKDTYTPTGYSSRTEKVEPNGEIH